MYRHASDRPKPQGRKQKLVTTVRIAVNNCSTTASPLYPRVGRNASGRKAKRRAARGCLARPARLEKHSPSTAKTKNTPTARSLVAKRCHHHDRRVQAGKEGQRLCGVSDDACETLGHSPNQPEPASNLPCARTANSSGKTRFVTSTAPALEPSHLPALPPSGPVTTAVATTTAATIAAAIANVDAVNRPRREHARLPCPLAPRPAALQTRAPARAAWRGWR